ncbi:hypothetical protein CBR_g27806 [Chara braunii]|uniref:tRNA-uridine aminocarboxypropyltransferase 1 n=1 Tax=Chara braunii TaxID=69332 RepID=A0A388L8D8_CHABU|nr:hypothetical protein CBR_g27806 [Chara braunii]|eukprot:GBG78581.1 hypothetical protein CBR_g27806 [Chara braunii]
MQECKIQEHAGTGRVGWRRDVNDMKDVELDDNAAEDGQAGWLSMDVACDDASGVTGSECLVWSIENEVSMEEERARIRGLRLREQQNELRAELRKQKQEESLRRERERERARNQKMIYLAGGETQGLSRILKTVKVTAGSTPIDEVKQRLSSGKRDVRGTGERGEDSVSHERDEPHENGRRSGLSDQCRLDDGAVDEVSADFHDSLLLSSQAPLVDAQARQSCHVCGKFRLFFCYDCIVPLVKPIPRLKLPFFVDIIQHGEENNNATGVQAEILAPNWVRVFRHASGNTHHRRMPPSKMELPLYDLSKTAVLLPGQGISKPLKEVIAQMEEERVAVGTEREAQDTGNELGALERVVVIDSKWRRANPMAADPRLRKLRRIHLSSPPQTAFWRRAQPHTRGFREEGVCTIEAIFLLCREMHMDGYCGPGEGGGTRPPCSGRPVCHCFDDLLFFYSFMWQYIRGKNEQNRPPVDSSFQDRL